MRNSKPFMLAALAGVLAASASQLPAGKPGIVRISDANRSGVPAAQINYSQAGDIDYASGGCQSGNCGYGYDDDLFDDDDGSGGSFAPDHGWGRPIKRPINRLPVLYQKYWPDAWYGQRGAQFGGAGVNYYPQVYMPTDTTQLGFYYQRVPFWRPNPGMIPPVPWPSQWHKRECGAEPFATGIIGASGEACGCETSNDLQPVPDAVDDAPTDSQDAPPAPRTLENDTAQNLIP